MKKQKNQKNSKESSTYTEYLQDYFPEDHKSRIAEQIRTQEGKKVILKDSLSRVSKSLTM